MGLEPIFKHDHRPKLAAAAAAADAWCEYTLSVLEKAQLHSNILHIKYNCAAFSFRKIYLLLIYD